MANLYNFFLKNFANIVDIGERILYYVQADVVTSGCSAVGSARGLGPWGREFESLHPDQQKTEGNGPLAQLVRAAGS